VAEKKPRCRCDAPHAVDREGIGSHDGDATHRGSAGRAPRRGACFSVAAPQAGGGISRKAYKVAARFVERPFCRSDRDSSGVGELQQSAPWKSAKNQDFRPTAGLGNNDLPFPSTGSVLRRLRDRAV
jgi:hypothetical protein